MADKDLTNDITTASALDGTELVHCVQSGNSRGTTTQDIANLTAFRGAGVSLASDATTLDFSAQADISQWDTEDWDTDAFWTVSAAERFTIPAAFNNAYFAFNVWVYMNSLTANEVNILIARHMNSADSILKMSYQNLDINGTAYNHNITMVRKVSTGDYFYSRYQTGADTSCTMVAQRSGMTLSFLGF